mgnify:CR=1 FL=1
MVVNVQYEVVESTRARNLRVTVYPDGRVLVTKPHRVSMGRVAPFIEARRAWIQSAQERFKKAKLRKEKTGRTDIQLPRPRRGSAEYKALVEQARALVTHKLGYFNAQYQFSYGTIAIRNQRTRWGSCSNKNNLSFNYRIALLPEALVDYLVVHELCHTKEHNHSARFWKQVERTIPDYTARRAQLTRYTF